MLLWHASFGDSLTETDFHLKRFLRSEEFETEKKTNMICRSNTSKHVSRKAMCTEA